VTALWQYYLALGVLGAAGIAAIQMPANAIVSRFFRHSRGAALGLVSAGASASAIVFYPLNTWLIVTFGWRTALLIFGGIVASITIPLAALCYGTPPMAAAPAVATPVADRDWTLAAALRSVPFWAVFLMWCFGVIGYQIVTTHQVAHGIDRGFSPLTLGWIYGLGGACTVIGNLVGGSLSDRWGREVVFTIGSAMGIAGIACLAWVDTPDDVALLLLYAASGFGFGMRISLLAAIPTDLFAGPHLGVILGAAHAGGGIGGFVGPWIGGLMFDVTGSYQVAFATAAVAIGASAVATWVAAPRRVHARRIAGRV
jgi:MFS family permease